MIRRLALALMVAAFATAADAEPLSVRCDNIYYIPIRQPYFVTFDVPANRLILQSPNGNLIKGEILSADDDKLELSLEAVGGRILLTYFRKGSMHWPGLPSREFGRAPLDHVCKAAAERTMLSAASQPGDPEFDPARVDDFSLRCPGPFDQFFFITMDRANKVVLLQTPSGFPIPGKITNIDGGKISFSIAINDKPFGDAVWDEQSQVLTGAGASRDAPGWFKKPLQCTTMKARSVMELYDRLH